MAGRALPLASVTLPVIFTWANKAKAKNCVQKKRTLTRQLNSPDGRLSLINCCFGSKIN
jgi:hypothetical protein